MKKILTVSLFAVMAVSAAHAQIASVEYVKGDNVLGLTDEQTVISELNAAVVPAVKALQTKVEDISKGTGLTLGKDAVSSVNIADGAVALVDLNNDVTDAITNAESDANAYTDEKVGALDGKTGKDVADGNYVVQTTEEDGIVTVSRQAFDTTISTAEGAEHSKVTAPTTDAVVTYVDDRVQSVADTVGDASAAIETLTTNLSAEVDRAKVAEQKIATYDEDGDLVGGSVKANADAITALTNGAVQDNTDAIAAEKSRAEGAEAGLQTAIDAINNTTTGILATAKADSDAKINALDATVAVEKDSNEFVTGVVEENGLLKTVQSSTIDAAVVALASVPEQCGANGSNKCALSVKNGTFSWEIIEE